MAKRVWEVESVVTVFVLSEVKADSPRKAVESVKMELEGRFLDVNSRHKGIVLTNIRKPGVGTFIETESVWDDDRVPVDPARWE